MTKNTQTEGIILQNNLPLARNMYVWQSLIQLSRGKRFFERFDLRCEGYVREEQCRDYIRDGWRIGAVSARAMQFNGKEVELTGRHGKRAALLIHFQNQTIKIITREPTKRQTEYITECGSKMKRIPLVVHSAEELKARIWAE